MAGGLEEGRQDRQLATPFKWAAHNGPLPDDDDVLPTGLEELLLGNLDWVDGPELQLPEGSLTTSFDKDRSGTRQGDAQEQAQSLLDRCADQQSESSRPPLGANAFSFRDPSSDAGWSEVAPDLSQVTLDGSPPAGRTKRVSFKDKSPAEKALLVKARNRKAQQAFRNRQKGIAVAKEAQWDTLQQQLQALERRCAELLARTEALELEVMQLKSGRQGGRGPALATFASA